MANNADLKVVGIGTVEADAQLVSSGMIEAKEEALVENFRVGCVETA